MFLVVQRYEKLIGEFLSDRIDRLQNGVTGWDDLIHCSLFLVFLANDSIARLPILTDRLAQTFKCFG